MARRKREPMSEGKKNVIGMLLEEYDIKSSRTRDYAIQYYRTQHSKSQLQKGAFISRTSYFPR